MSDGQEQQYSAEQLRAQQPPLPADIDEKQIYKRFDFLIEQERSIRCQFQCNDCCCSTCLFGIGGFIWCGLSMRASRRAERQRINDSINRKFCVVMKDGTMITHLGRCSIDKFNIMGLNITDTTLEEKAEFCGAVDECAYQTMTLANLSVRKGDNQRLIGLADTAGLQKLIDDIRGDRVKFDAPSSDSSKAGHVQTAPRAPAAVGQQHNRV